jgi:sulfofructose kinase
VFRVPSWPSGSAKVRASAYRESGGGMAANAAAAIAQLGGEAVFWGPAGDDAIADAMAAELQSFGVDVAGLKRIPGARSSHSAILVDDQGERLIVGVRGNVLAIDADWLPVHELAAAQAVLADVRWPNGARRALASARQHGVPAVLDADIAEVPTLDELVGLADYAVFSTPGLQAFASGTAAEGLRHALDSGARVAIVTRGERGVDWMTAEAPDTLHHLAAHPIARAADTTGAGDVFHGAFALAIAERRPLDEAIRFANVAAALKCEHEGARAVPARSDCERALSQR